MTPATAPGAAAPPDLLRHSVFQRRVLDAGQRTRTAPRPAATERGGYPGTALVMYDTETGPAKSAPGAEWVTVKDGKITYSRNVFDSAPLVAAPVILKVRWVKVGALREAIGLGGWYREQITAHDRPRAYSYRVVHSIRRSITRAAR